MDQLIRENEAKLAAMVEDKFQALSAELSRKHEVGTLKTIEEKLNKNVSEEISKFDNAMKDWKRGTEEELNVFFTPFFCRI